MIPKKTKKANLENKRFLFFQIGLLISLATAFLAFEWSTGAPKVKILDGNPGDPFIPDLIDITYRKDNPPPVIKPPDLAFVIRDNSAELIDQTVDFSTEIDPWDGVDFSNLPDITENPVDDVPFRKVEDMPSFQNGDISNFVKYIQSNVIYREEAIEMQIQGKVFADFVVNKEGYIENVKIVRGVDPLLDNEVIKALKASPRWKPGKQRNIPVKVAFTIPIVFKLQ